MKQKNKFRLSLILLLCLSVLVSACSFGDTDISTGLDSSASVGISDPVTSSSSVSEIPDTSFSGDLSSDSASEDQSGNISSDLTSDSGSSGSGDGGSQNTAPAETDVPATTPQASPTAAAAPGSGSSSETTEPGTAPTTSITTLPAATNPGTSQPSPTVPVPQIGFHEHVVSQDALNPVPDSSGLWQRWPSQLTTPALLGMDLSSYKGKSKNSSALAGITVILDAGHGGKDPGALGKAAEGITILEKDINLAVTMKAKEHLEALGATVILTRSDDSWVSLYRRVAIAGFQTVNYWKSGLSRQGLSASWLDSIQSELQKQYSINEDLVETGGRGFSQGMGAHPMLRQLLDAEGMTDHILFITIHANSSEKETTARGLQVYIATNQSVYDSELSMILDMPSDPEVLPMHPNYTGYNDVDRLRLANQLYSSITGVVPELAAGGTTVFAGNYSFLREINYTSALVEMGFMSNSSDLEILLNEVSQDAIAQGIADGVYGYFSR